MKQFLDASGLNLYTNALKNGTLVVGKAVDASNALRANAVPATGIDGIIPLENIPQGAIDKLIQVANQAARLALTTANVQNGDSVQELDSKKMFIVIDEEKLGTEDAEAAFVEYTAGRATFAQDASHADFATAAQDASYAKDASTAFRATSAATADVANEVDWSNVVNKDSSYAPAPHTQDGSTITALTGYSKAVEAANVGSTDSLLVALGKIEKKADDASAAAGFHTQDGSTIIGLDGYNGPADTYTGVASNDSLKSALAKIERKALDASNTADWDSITKKPATYDASIVTMGGYEKKTGNVAATDSVLVAVGKVEKKVDDVATAFEGHTHTSADVSTLSGYAVASEYAAIADGDSLNVALGKIEKKALDSSNTATWTGVTDKPTEFTPEAHDAAKVTSIENYTTQGISGDVASTDDLKTALAKIEVKANSGADEAIPDATINAIIGGTFGQ